MVTHARRAHAPHHLGIALSVTELCVAYLGSRAEPLVRRLPLEPMPADGAGWPALERAFAELKSNPGGERMSISLLPPLAEIRSVELPPLREDEAERVLARNAARYFVTARQPQLVGVVRNRRGRTSRASSNVVAAATPARLVMAIRAAAHEAGFELDGIGPAESAWASAAMSLWPRLDGAAAMVVIAHPDRTDVLQVVDGRLGALRRFRAGSADADLIVDTVRHADAGQIESVRVVVLGVPDESAALIGALSARGITASGVGPRSDPAVLAAEYAAPSTGPIFRTDDVRAAWRAAAWRSTSLVAAAAVALLVAGAAVRLWGVHRQLDIVRAQRVRLAPRLSATLLGRTSVEGVYRNVAGLNAVEYTAPSWAHTIASLTAALPDGAYLTAFRTRGDSLIVEGLADQASDVFDAMEQLPTLANVRAGAPVRRELQEDTTALERFTIVARQVTNRSLGGAR